MNTSACAYTYVHMCTHKHTTRHVGIPIHTCLGMLMLVHTCATVWSNMADSHADKRTWSRKFVCTSVKYAHMAVRMVARACAIHTSIPTTHAPAFVSLVSTYLLCTIGSGHLHQHANACTCSMHAYANKHSNTRMCMCSHDRIARLSYPIRGRGGPHMPCLASFHENPTARVEISWWGERRSWKAENKYVRI